MEVNAREQDQETVPSNALGSLRLYTFLRGGIILSDQEEQQWLYLRRTLAKAAGGGLLAQIIQALLDVANKDRSR